MAPALPPDSRHTVLTGAAPITYNLKAPTPSTTSIVADFSLDGGATFHACTPGPGGDGTSGIENGTGTNYHSHTFVWDTLADVGPRYVPNVIVRIKPDDGGWITKRTHDVDDREPRPDPDIALGPYLQATTSSSVTVVWRTWTPSDSVVLWRDLGGNTGTASTSGSDTSHAVQLTGLAAGTQYAYRIVENGKNATPWHVFATAPAPAATFTAAVIGDSGGGTQQQFDLAALLSRQSIDLLLHTGDLVYPTGLAADYPAKFFLPFGRIIDEHPVFPTIGMHDQEDGQSGAPYAQFFFMVPNNPAQSKKYYSFVFGDVKFVSIDTENTFRRAGPHLDWLDQELANSTSHWLVVYMHASPYSAGPHGDAPDLQRLIVPILEKHEVDLVLAGHDHIYERMAPFKHFSTDASWPGIPYVITGGGGAQPYSIVKPEPTDQHAEVGFHFVLLTFSPDAIQGRMVRLNGTDGDDFTIPHVTSR
jgi:hypothetical protein